MIDVDICIVMKRPIIVKKRWISTLFSLLIVGVTLGQTGTIKGVVQTREDGVTIWGASVYIAGTIYSSYTEEDGSFILENINPGTYNISTEDFTTGDSALTAGIIVVAGETTFVTVKVGVSVKLGEIIQISYEQPKSETVAAALEEEKSETKTVTIVSSADFKAKGDSKVADAAGRASGVTVEGGKYVYIRGLSDRYSKTLLDGTEIPGLDPNRNAVQLDMFPTSFVQSLKVVKTFTPDLPGDFTGGLVDIRTKDFPDSMVVSVSAGLKYNTQASFNNNFLSSQKSGTDFLGFDGGLRSLPVVVTNFIENKSFPQYVKALGDPSVAANLEAASDLMNDDMVPTTGSSLTPFNFGATFGNTIKINQKGDSLGLKTQRKFGYIFGMNYRSSLSYYNDGTTNVYDLAGDLTEKSELNPQRLMAMERASEEVLLGAISKFGFEFNPRNNIGFSYLKNQSGKNTASIAQGMNIDDEFFYRSQRMGYTERSMDNFILTGTHKQKEKKSTDSRFSSMTLDWAYAFTMSSQEEPDLRFFNDNFDADGNAEFREQNYTGPVRYWRDMQEFNNDAKINLTIPVQLDSSRVMKLKTGASFVNKNRAFDEKRLDYRMGPNAVYNGNLVDFLSDVNTGWLANDAGVYLVDQTNEVNNYTGLSNVISGYVMAEIPFTSRLNTVIGARVESTNFEVQSQKVGSEPSTLSALDVLPSINLSYNLVEAKEQKDTAKNGLGELKMRMSYSTTLARPNFRELAPFAVEDFVNNSIVIGNPDLVLTEIDNYDIRFEYYPKSGEQLSIAGFYKDFTNPIEQITSPTAANIEYTWVNNSKGRLCGVEFELRKGLDFISKKLNNFSAAGNLTLVKSLADVNSEELNLIRGNDPDHLDTRPMFGQSPYIINGTLSYKNDSSGIKANVSFNVFGERLVLVTKGGLPDIYELARPSLDFNLSKEFSKKLKLTFRAKNLLNPDFKQVYKVKTESAKYLISTDDESFVYRNYKTGVNISLGVSYKF